MEQKINTHKLNSGLTLAMVPMATESVTVLFLVRAGSRDEAEGQYGAAHFLEHFVFKGTKKYPKVNDVTKAVDRLGGKQNAFTWTDFTGFWVKLAANHLDVAADVVGQLVSEPLFPDKELEKEKGTIIEEIHMGEDHLPIKAWREFEDLIFPRSALGRPILGTAESINAMKTTDLKTFWGSWYTPDNAIVVVAGGVSELEKVKNQIEQNFSAFDGKKGHPTRSGYDQVFTQHSPRVKLTYRKSEQAHLVLGTRALAATDSRLEALWVLTTIMGGNMSSRLWNEIREKRGLAYYIKAGFDARVDNGTWTVRAGVRIKDAEEAVKVIVGQLEKVANKGVTSEELLMGKEAVKGNLKLDLEDSMEMAELLADHWAMTAGQIQMPSELMDKISRVTAEDVRQVAQDILKTEKLNLSLVGPFKGDERFLSAIK